MSELTNLAETLRLGGWAVYPLTVLAVAALAIVLDRAYVFWRCARVPVELADAIGQAWNDAGEVAAQERFAAALERLPSRHAFHRVARLFDERGAPLWRIETRIDAVAVQIQRDIGRGLWLLETIVTAAPLVGLLGTIVGMMQSFKLIGTGLLNPAGITGGVAQALIATAIGIVIALVALFAFNFFSRRIDALMDELESFANGRLADLRIARDGSAS
ncbi:MotA/TolQ/ExbB proton channel family protein [Paraburkholderia sp. NMBU_R16]|uniref:MotA/TolQ/ExbB proton channel family protein n=1 Tax=Paraburkholderia sp. NMBU_R16 TaxID=2698676 RepID=UPI00156788A3|nr:MotA/TolQ/ExbB proton channel family protein [Paraburkholderia sp. NMBU_R16]NRO98317.1 MotA/TolQ/ExbB proton channel family protein [Paraburkholderia sp. NMBU_R16]